ncbi:Sec-independent protein translocase protein TatB [Sorangium sp. So ce854]|uniref:Sec-independent protein translocase protein TatB n=1 Tax=Sorangium sp. So ce854 TaxID=3133322 RepID=UPI003F5E6CC4
MFGFSFGEIVVLIIVGIIVVGPRRLPAMMRTAGSWITKLRRMMTDFRTQSGIDDLIRQEGLERELRELRALSRVNVIETLVNPVRDAAAAVGTVASATPRVRPPEPEPQPEPEPPPNVKPLREREYPVLGCDAYGAEIDAEPAGATSPAATATDAAPAAAGAAPATAEPAATQATATTGPAATQPATTTEPAATQPTAAHAAATQAAMTEKDTVTQTAAAQGAAGSGAAS